MYLRWLTAATAALVLLPGPFGRAGAPEDPPAPPAPPPPPSGAARLGVIRLDRAHPAEALPPQRLEGLPPPPARATPLRFPVEEGVIFEPQLEQEDPSSRLQLKGMFRMDLQRP